MKKLPDLVVTVNAQVVSSNFDVFKQDADMFLESINQDLETSEDFVQAKATVKNCKFVEDQMERIIGEIINNSQDVGTLLANVKAIKGKFTTIRLSLNTKVSNEEKVLKAKALKEAQEEVEDFIACMNKIIDPHEIDYTIGMNVFDQAIKGKRTMETSKKALGLVVFDIKKEIQEQVDLVKKNTDSYNKLAGGFGFLFHDLSTVIHKPHDDFVILVNGRIDGYELASKAEDDEGEPVDVPVTFTTDPVSKTGFGIPISGEIREQDPQVFGNATGFPTPTPQQVIPQEEPIIQAARDWHVAKSKEARLAKMLIETLNERGELGTFEHDLGKGYRVVCETAQHRTVSNYDAICSVINTLDENSVPTLDIFSREWKIDQNEYAKLDPKIIKWVDDQCIKITIVSNIKIISPDENAA